MYHLIASIIISIKACIELYKTETAFYISFGHLHISGSQKPSSGRKKQNQSSKAQRSGSVTPNRTQSKSNPANFTTDDDSVVTLKSANGEDIQFIEIAGIAHKGNFHAILQPVERMEGLADDEAIVFKVSRTPNGDDSFEIVLDDDIIDAVFAEYDRLYEQENGK